MAHFPADQETGGINSSTAAVAGSGAAPAAPASGVPNSSPLNMFPQVKLVVLCVLPLSLEVSLTFL